MPPEVAISCESVGRSFGRGSGARWALRDLSLEIPAGTVYGLLGPNGAGKTTLMRILSTLLLPSAGTARVFGHDVATAPDDVRAHMGLILGGDRGFYARLSGRQNLRYFAALSRLRARDADEAVDAALHAVELVEDGDRSVAEYSRGMRQRLHIARGLITSPDVLLMDEPTIGLDPEHALQVRELVPRLVSEGRTVLLTTHYMLEADELCDQIAILDHGRLVAVGTSADIKRRFALVGVVEFEAAGLERATIARIGTLPGVRHVMTTQDGPYARVRVVHDAGEVIEDQIAAAVAPSAAPQFVRRLPTLEEAYLSLLQPAT
jgi:ABC-2 type transport system ATP-binding protein